MTPFDQSSFDGASDDFKRRNPALFKQPPTGQVDDGVYASEAKLHEDIISYCKARTWIYFHGSMAKATARTIGEPDFTILADRGRVFFVECKGRDTKVRPEQLGLMLWAGNLGHTIHIVRSMDEFRRLVT